YPWRGQFSPGLIDFLLDAFARHDTVVLDPFVGSGTTLFESSRRGLECFGSEISPAAAELAGVARFSNLVSNEREGVIDRANSLIDEFLVDYLPLSLFRPVLLSRGDGTSIGVCIRDLLGAAENEYARNLLASSVMLAMGDSDVLDGGEFLRAYARNCG